MRISFISTSSEIALRRISEKTFDVKSALVQIMAWFPIWWSEARMSTWHLLNVIIFVIYFTDISYLMLSYRSLDICEQTLVEFKMLVFSVRNKNHLVIIICKMPAI